MKMEELARFCVRNEGKMKKNLSIRVFVASKCQLEANLTSSIDSSIVL